jgi:hypothetical protein
MPAQFAHSPTGGRVPSEREPRLRKNSFPTDKEKVSPSLLWDGTMSIVLQLLPSCLVEELRRHSLPPAQMQRTCWCTFVAVCLQPYAHKPHFVSPEIEGKRTPQCKKTAFVAGFAAAAWLPVRRRAQSVLSHSQYLIFCRYWEEPHSDGARDAER